MGTFIAKAYHPENGRTEDIYEGFSWETLIFGSFYYLYKDMWAWGVISFGTAIVTMGISWIIFPFFFNDQYATFLLNKGYLTKKQWEEKNKVVSPIVEKKSVGDELEKLFSLKEKGILTEDEFLKEKEKILNS